MRRSRFTEEQIIGVLKEAQAGSSTGELCRRHGISRQTFYGWKRKYGEMDVSEARRLKQLEEEPAAEEGGGGSHAGQADPGRRVEGRKKLLTSAQRRELVRTVAASERRACRVLNEPRSGVRYRSQRVRDDTALRGKIRDLAEAKPRWGCPQITRILKRDHGVTDNHKRIERLYGLERLQLPRRRKKRTSWVQREPAKTPTRPNERWSMDFVHDGMANGRQVKVLSIVDDFSKKSPTIDIASSITGHGVVDVLEELAQWHPLPDEIVVDNGPEFRSVVLDQWAYERGVKLRFIEPGKPVQNCFVESFNGKLRYECLDMHWFRNIDHAREEIAKWWVEYNTYRTHSSLGGITPAEFERRQSEAGCQQMVGS